MTRIATAVRVILLIALPTVFNYIRRMTYEEFLLHKTAAMEKRAIAWIPVLKGLGWAALATGAPMYAIDALTGRSADQRDQMERMIQANNSLAEQMYINNVMRTDQLTNNQAAQPSWFERNPGWTAAGALGALGLGGYAAVKVLRGSDLVEDSDEESEYEYEEE